MENNELSMWRVGVVMFFRPETDEAGQPTGKFQMMADLPRGDKMPLALLKNFAGLLVSTIANYEKAAADAAKQSSDKRLIV